jgi:hypothetical protein
VAMLFHRSVDIQMWSTCIGHGDKSREEKP